MPQTSYARSMAPALPGQIADNNPHTVDTALNKSNSSLAAGIAVKYGALTPTGGSAPVGSPPNNGGSNDGSAVTLLTASTDYIAGITALSFAADPYNIAGTATYREGTTANLLTKGRIFVAAEQPCSPGDSVNVRFQAVAGNTTIGAFTNTPDGGTRVVKGAKWVTKSVQAAAVNLETVAQNIAELDFDALVDMATH